MAYYTLFWIPVRISPFKGKTIRDKFDVKTKDPGFFNNDETGSIVLSIKKISDTEFKIFISENAKTPHEENINNELLTLSKIEIDPLGFIEFEILPIENRYPFSSIWNSLSIDIYRVLKSLYHKHQYHNKKEYFINCDNIEYCSERILITKNGSFEKFQEFYLSYIKDKLKEYRDFIIPRIEKKHRLNYQYRLLVKPSKVNNLLIIRRYVDNATEVSKYLVILHSIDSPHVDKLKLFTNDIERLRNQLCDIYNARRSSNSVFLGLSGLVLGVFSFGLSIYWSSQSASNQDILNEQIRRKEDSNTKLILDNVNELKELVLDLKKKDSILQNKIDRIDSLIKHPKLELKKDQFEVLYY